MAHFLQEQTGAGSCPFPGELWVGQPCWLSIWRTARSLPTAGKSREHTGSKALQEAQEKPAGVRAQLLQISKGSILELSLDNITDGHICREFVRMFNSLLSLAV